jgi:hypothetical protein
METKQPSPATANADQMPRSNPWTLPLVLVAGAALACTWLLVNRAANDTAATHNAAAAEASWTPAPRPEGQTVSLEIDFGNGARREFQALAWAEGMTLGKLMQNAKDFRPGVRYTQKGTGEMAFLTSLEGVANEGPGGRYWFYAVGEQRGEVSFEVQPLRAGERVLWVFKRPD